MVRLVGNYYEMDLEDGSVRMTFSKDSTETEKLFPACVQDETNIIENTMDHVDNIVINMLNKILGKEVLAVRDHTNQIPLEDLPSKTHLHLYKAGETRHSSRHGHSYPYHTDNGLYLLVTPAANLPLVLTNRRGHVVTTGHLPADSIIFIVGGGLSSWLLPSSSEISPYAAPHAVPSLSFAHRTVVARMKVAPLSSTPLHSQKTFEEHFFTTEDASLCPLKTWESAHRSMCAEGESMCWMDTCLPVPEDCTNTPVCVNEMLEPCCTPDVTEGCVAHDESCYWAC